MNTRKIILDTDPGIDDAVAIAVLLKARKDKVGLILTSYGNTSIDNTTRNAAALVSILGAADIPVVRGAAGPAPGGNGAYGDASNIHGGDGLGGMQRSLSENLRIKEAISGDYLKIPFDLMRDEKSIDYIALGPLTNLSSLIRKYPEAANMINQVVIMGGGIEKGNVTADAEFNIYCDAESANHVFSTMPNIILTPLDTTTKVFFDLCDIEKIGKAGTKIANFMASILRVNHRLCVAYGDGGAVMHDSTAVLAYLYPKLFEFRACSINVVTAKERYGKCICGTDGSNVRIADALDPKQLLDIILKSIINL